MYLKNHLVMTIQCDGKHLFPKRLTVSGPNLGDCQRQAREKGWTFRNAVVDRTQTTTAGPVKIYRLSCPRCK